MVFGAHRCKYKILETSFELMPQKRSNTASFKCWVVWFTWYARKHIKQSKLHSRVQDILSSWLHESMHSTFQAYGEHLCRKTPSIAHQGKISQISWAHAPSKTKALLRGNGKHLRATLWWHQLFPYWPNNQNGWVSISTLLLSVL